MTLKRLSIFCLFILLSLSACGTTTYPTVTPTIVIEQPTLTFTPMPSPTDTVQPTITPSPTIEPTKQSAKMEELLQDLKAKGVISTVDGSYHHIPDFKQDWAQIGYYQYWFTEYDSRNFVVQADIEIESASKTANFGDSGCGFVYHTWDGSTHHATLLMMDGKVKTYRSVKNNWTSLKGGSVGKVKPPFTKAHMVLVVENQKIVVFIDGNEVVNFEDPKLLDDLNKKLALTLASGTNKGFGTRCIMKNMDLWRLS